MKYACLLVFCFLLVDCKTAKLNKLNNVMLEVKIDELNTLSELQFKTIEILVVALGKMKALPPQSIDLSADINTMQEEIDMLNKLRVLKKFKKLKALYFPNIYLSKIPIEVIGLKHLQYLQFNYYSFFDPKIESQKLAKIKKLKSLSIDKFYLPKEKIDLLTIELIKLKIDNILIN